MIKLTSNLLNRESIDNIKAVNIAEKIAEDYNSNQSIKSKKKKGQYFTSRDISNYMANFVDLNKRSVKIVEPGAGTGILIASLVDRIVSENINIDLEVDLFETDSDILPHLDQVMKVCQKLMKDIGNSFNYRIIEEDFILFFRDFFSFDLFSNDKITADYDYVISNPPYFKISKEHEYSKILSEYVHGQPNIYYMFMAVASKILSLEGQLIFITPRSFTSGAYFDRFRETFLRDITIEHLHLFNSRKDNFSNENVLQENLILIGTRKNEDNTEVMISSSNSGISDNSYETIKVKYTDMISENDSKKRIRIPTNSHQYEIMKKIDNWDNNLGNMNLSISTGKVVPFRNKGMIVKYENEYTYPLIYMKNLKIPYTIFPISDTDKGIKKNCTESLLVPSKDYLLIKRFTSKEQKRRVESSIYDSSKFKDINFIGIENHVNYIYKIEGKFSSAELYGLSMILNSGHIDTYFRIINGNTQVNVSDLKPLPLPSTEVIKLIGEKSIEGVVTLDNIDSYLKEI